MERVSEQSRLRVVDGVLSERQHVSAPDAQGWLRKVARGAGALFSGAKKTPVAKSVIVASDVFELVERPEPSACKPPRFLAEPKTQRLFVEPYLCKSDGKTYERDTLTRQQRQAGTIPNFMLKSLCDTWLSCSHKALEEQREALRQVLFCPIGQDIVEDACCAEDGHTYSFDDLNQWWQQSKTSPLSRQHLTAGAVWRNQAIGEALLDLKLIDQTGAKFYAEPGSCRRALTVTLSAQETWPILRYDERGSENRWLVESQLERLGDEMWRYM